MAFESTHPSLLSRVRDPANAGAWREFESRYGSLILGYCRRLGLQLTDAEDVRQVVMTDLSKALPKFEFEPQRGKFRTYLYRVVRNAVSKHFRRHATSDQALDSTVLAKTPGENESDTDEKWEQVWILHHYRMAMEVLRTTYDAKSLQVFDQLVAGRAIGDIAGGFDMTPEAVRKIKQRVKARLQIIVAEQIREEDHPNEQP